MRKFVLPDNTDMDKIGAVCSDGVLTVTVEILLTNGQIHTHIG
jgi:HSP20 family molecular chaperone IbpA